MSELDKVSARRLDGGNQSLAAYKGKVLLIVNVASGCGFTPQYAGLEALWRKYRKRGLVVLGFPCNQFGGQEPGDEAAIGEFCSLTYDVTFPMFAKVDVNGDATHPIFAFLKAAAPGVLVPGRACGQGLLDVGPVSYTHLDVYKRQPSVGSPTAW